MDIIYHLKKMEEILRTAPRHQTLSGSVIMLPEDTAQLWRNVVLELLDTPGEQAAQHIIVADVPSWDCQHCDNRKIGAAFSECPNCGTARG